MSRGSWNVLSERGSHASVIAYTQARRRSNDPCSGRRRSADQGSGDFNDVVSAELAALRERLLLLHAESTSQLQLEVERLRASSASGRQKYSAQMDSRKISQLSGLSGGSMFSGRNREDPSDDDSSAVGLAKKGSLSRPRPKQSARHHAMSAPSVASPLPGSCLDLAREAGETVTAELDERLSRRCWISEPKAEEAGTASAAITSKGSPTPSGGAEAPLRPQRTASLPAAVGIWNPVKESPQQKRQQRHTVHQKLRESQGAASLPGASTCDSVSDSIYDDEYESEDGPEVSIQLQRLKKASASDVMDEASDEDGEIGGFELLTHWMPPKGEDRRMSRKMSRSMNMKGALDQLVGVTPTAENKSSPSRRSGSHLGMLQQLSGQFLGVLATVLSELQISHNSMFHWSWEFFGVLLITFDVIVLPLQAFDLRFSNVMDTASWVTRSYWLFDMFKNFLTSYITEEGKVEESPPAIAYHYWSTWLMLDAVCSVCDWVALLYPVWFSVEAITFVHCIRLSRALKVPRLLKAPGVTRFRNHYLSSGRMQLMEGIVISMVRMVVVAHLFACAWYGVGHYEGNWKTRAETGWVEYYDIERASFVNRYSTSFYWSLGQFVGEVVFSPRSSVERIFAIMVLFVSLLFSSLFISSITTAMTRFQLETTQQAADMAVLRQYLDDNGTSSSLIVRATRFVEAALAKAEKNVPESKVVLFDFLSEPLREELHVEHHLPVLQFHPFFSSYFYVNPAGVRRICHVAVIALHMDMGDVVFHSFETPVWPRMFCVSSGTLHYLKDEEDAVQLRRGDWAAEPALWTRWMHCGTLQVLNDAVLLQVDGAKFWKIVTMFSTPHARDYAAQYVSILNSTEHDELTDLQTEGVIACVEKAFSEVNMTLR